MSMSQTSAAERKRKSRAAAKAAGITRLEVLLGEAELQRLDELCRVRGGVRGPYSADEYISLLIHRDWQRLQQQLAELGHCAHCRDALPQGCNGLFKGDSRCWHTEQAKRLAL